eukprot:385484_1
MEVFSARRQYNNRISPIWTRLAGSKLTKKSSHVFVLASSPIASFISLSTTSPSSSHTVRKQTTYFFWSESFLRRTDALKPQGVGSESITSGQFTSRPSIKELKRP